MNGTKKFHHDYGTKHGHPPLAKKTICVDYDATIFPWGNLLNPDAEPLPGAVEAIRKMAIEGYRIVIFTSRMSDRWLNDSGNDKDEQRRYIETMLNKWKIPYTEILGEKVPALAYIDDRAIEFTGDNWAQIAERAVQL